MHFGILSDIINSPVEDSPAIVIARVLCDLLLGVVDVIRILNQGGFHSRLHYEFTLRHSILDWDFGSWYCGQKRFFRTVLAIFMLSSLRQLLNVE